MIKCRGRNLHHVVGMIRTHVGDQAPDGRDGVEFDGVATRPDGGLGGRLRRNVGASASRKKYGLTREYSMG